MAIPWAQIIPWIVAGGASLGQVLGARAQTGALEKASEQQAASADKALAAVLGMWATRRADLAPYREANLSALPLLLKMSKVPLPAGGFSNLANPRAGIPSSLAGLFAAAGAGDPLAGPDFSNMPVLNAGGRLGSVARRAGTGAGLGASFGASGGPVFAGLGAAGGAIYGGLSGLFKNPNAQSKEWGSESINRVSNWTWKTLMPAIQSGQISPEEGESAFRDVWNRWTQGMETSGLRPDIIKSSIADQTRWFSPFFTEINRLKARASNATGSASASY